MDKNIMKKKLEEGKTCLGTWVFLPSCDIMEIIGLAGFDFAVIDMEHSAITLKDSVDMIRAAESQGLTPLLRVSSLDHSLVLRALDSGAHGVQFPHIENDSEARDAVAYVKYFPIGQRGMATTTKGGGYTLDNIQEYITRENESNLIVVSLESKESLTHLTQIARVPDIDVIYIGPYDLSQSLGIPGEVENPKVLKVMEENIRIIRKAGKIAGSFARTANRSKQLKDMGVNYLTCQADGSIIREAYEALRKQILGK